MQSSVKGTGRPSGEGGEQLSPEKHILAGSGEQASAGIYSRADTEAVKQERTVPPPPPPPQHTRTRPFRHGEASSRKRKRRGGGPWQF